MSGPGESRYASKRHGFMPVSQREGDRAWLRYATTQGVQEHPRFYTKDKLREIARRIGRAELKALELQWELAEAQR